MAATGRVKAWQQLLKNNINIPIAFDRQQGDSLKSLPFNLTIKSIDGIKQKSDGGPVEYQVRLVMFDLAYKQFFGRAWTSPVIPAKKSGTKIKLEVNQNVYFHTSLTDENIAVVMEIICTTKAGGGKMLQRSCGWSVMRIFKYEGKMVDTSSSSSAPTQKLSIYQGSPLALLSLDEPPEGSGQLTAISSCTLLYTIRTHQNFCKALHLIDENCIVGTNDVIPGLYEGSKDTKTAVPDALRKPRLLKALSGYIEKLSISFSCPMDKLEEDICHLLGDDRLSRLNNEADGHVLQITERKLMVGVHNGWSYVSDPITVSLSAQDSSNTSLKRVGSKHGHKRSPSSSSLGLANALVHKHRIELDGLLEDPNFCIVFTLIYDICETTASKDKRNSARQNPFSVAIRWAAWCPLVNLNVQDNTVNLIGGPGPNPEDLLLFQSQTADNVGSSASLAGLSGGTIHFSFFNELRRNDSIVPGTESQMLQVPQLSGRYGSRASEDGSVIMNEVQVTGRPPLHPSSASPRSLIQAGYSQEPTNGSMCWQAPEQAVSGIAQEMHQMSVPPLIGIGGSPPQTGYMYGMPGMPGAGMPGGGMPMPMPYGTTPRGYMPVEVSHIRESGTYMGWPMGSSRMGMASQDLQELPFTPLHAPITAMAPGMHSGQPLSRASYAKLYSAGFQPILDRIGEPAEVIDPNDMTSFIAAKEDMDRLKSNEIYIQFLAYARVACFESAGANKQPSTVFFTFQFYRYPQVTTERLLLGNADGHLGNDPMAVPCLLQRLDKDGSLLKGNPGYMLKYLVDPAYLKPGEGRLFVQNLSQATLHLDVWDGDTLHLIGSSAVDLKHLCRQNREAVQVTYELDIISQDIIDPEGIMPSGDLLRDGGVLPASVSQLIKGRLHLRLANVGHFSDTKIPKADLVIHAQKPKLIIKAESGTAFMGGSLNAVKQQVKALATTKIAKAMHVADTNHELAQILFSRRDQTQQEDTGREGGVDKKRKLQRMLALRQTMGNEANQTISTIRQEKDERNRDLKTIELYRTQGKRDGILNMLNTAISSEHTIHPAMGFVEFFEFVLRNPYNVEHTVTIDTDDPELTVITDVREWRHFKMINEVYTSVEEGMFNTESKSGKPEIFLRPKESVNVPFKYLTFKADHSVQPQAPSDPYKPQTKTGSFQKKAKMDPLQTRVIKAYFRTNEEKKPISILSLKVEPQPHIVDQTFRFYHPEQSFLKKSIRLPPLQTLPGVPVGGANYTQLWVRCSDNNVICTSRKVQQGEPHDIFLKVACGASPQIKRFFMAIYTDAYLSKPVQVWQFYTHAMQRVDVTCTEGQTSRFTLLLRGTQASRLVQCFPSSGAEMQISPKEPFMLAANTLQEVHVGVRPMHTGSKFLYINVVDIEYHQLIRSWLVCVTSQPSQVVKAYELNLPVGGGKSSNKKISYANPYPHKKVFYLRTNRDDLLQFKETRLELGAGETTNIGLRFAPTMSPTSVELLVFINDEDDKNEETFCVKANYQ